MSNPNVAVFRSALTSLGIGRPLNKVAAKATTRGIAVTTTNHGNSYEDLLLSVYVWRLGQDIKVGLPPSRFPHAVSSSYFPSECVCGSTSTLIFDFLT